MKLCNRVVLRPTHLLYANIKGPWSPKERVSPMNGSISHGRGMGFVPLMLKDLDCSQHAPTMATPAVHAATYHKSMVRSGLSYNR